MNANDYNISNGYGVVEVKTAICARCETESMIWGDVLLHKDVVASLPTEEELRKMGVKDLAPPPADTQLPLCPPCLKELESMKAMDLGYSREGIVGGESKN